MFTSLSFSICILSLFLGQVQSPDEGNTLTSPLIAEITVDHPLFLFTCKIQTADIGKVKVQWDSLDSSLKPFSALWLEFEPDVIHDPGELEDILGSIFQEFKCPFVLKIPDIMDKEVRLEHKEIENLFSRFPNMLGISIHDFTMNLYISNSREVIPDYSYISWLSQMIQILASYGRFLYWCMDSVDWARLLSHPFAEPLFNTMKNYPDYVVPAYRYNGDDSIIGVGEMLGLYMTNVVNRWGIVCSPTWYHENFLVEPCLFGKPPDGAISISSPLYRVMVLNGVIGGAVVYAFEDENALWMGKENIHWDKTIKPTLNELISINPIPQKNLIQQRINTGFRLYSSPNPLEFHKNLKEIDPQRDEGKMVQVIYNVSSPGKLPILIPENGNSYIIPILPSFLTNEQVSMFTNIVGYSPTHPEWTWSQVLSDTSKTMGEGTAFITNVGKWVFVFNSNEYEIVPQTYQLLNLPAPVRKFSANRVEDGVVLKWPFREGDISYQVYRRLPPDTSFQLVARGLDGREWKDTTALPQQTVAYSITALTSEQEPLSGTVNFGDYLMYNTVESRIVEETVLAPETFYAESVPILIPTEIIGERTGCKDTTEELEATQKEQAKAILKTMELFESSIIGKNIDSVINLFDPNYKDSSGRGVDYFRAGFELFFSQCDYPKVMWQVRRWLFETTAENQTQVKMTMFFKIRGYGLSDSLGIKGDIPTEIYSDANGETSFTWILRDNQWRISHIEPPVIELKKLASYTLSPYSNSTQ